MEIPTSYIEKFLPRVDEEKPAGQPRSSRDEMLDRFLDRLNPEREKDGYATYSHAHLAKKLKDAGFPESAWYGLYQSCDRARSFGRLFAHLTKAKT